MQKGHTPLKTHTLPRRPPQFTLKSARVPKRVILAIPRIHASPSVRKGRFSTRWARVSTPPALCSLTVPPAVGIPIRDLRSTTHYLNMSEPLPRLTLSSLASICVDRPTQHRCSVWIVMRVVQSVEGLAYAPCGNGEGLLLFQAAGFGSHMLPFRAQPYISDRSHHHAASTSRR